MTKELSKQVIAAFDEYDAALADERKRKEFYKGKCKTLESELASSKRDVKNRDEYINEIIETNKKLRAQLQLSNDMFNKALSELNKIKKNVVVDDKQYDDILMRIRKAKALNAYNS